MTLEEQNTDTFSACVSRKAKVHLDRNVERGASAGTITAKGKLGEMWTETEEE